MKWHNGSAKQVSWETPPTNKSEDNFKLKINTMRTTCYSQLHESLNLCCRLLSSSPFTEASQGVWAKISSCSRVRNKQEKETNVVPFLSSMPLVQICLEVTPNVKERVKKLRGKKQEKLLLTILYALQSSQNTSFIQPLISSKHQNQLAHLPTGLITLLPTSDSSLDSPSVTESNLSSLSPCSKRYTVLALTLPS